MFKVLIIICILMMLLPSSAQSSCVQPSRFEVGDRGIVTPGSANNVRSEPKTDAAKVGSIDGGAKFTVLEGAVCDESYVWLQVQARELIGWTVEANADDYWVQPVIGNIYANDFISLMIPPELAIDVTFEIEPEVEGMGGLIPIRQWLTFEQGDDKPRFPRYRLTVAPVADFRENEMRHGIEAIDELQALLETIPEFNAPILESVTPGKSPEPLSFPDDPFILGTKRILIALPHYVEMENGRGIAFITMYGQDIFPVTNESLFYNFIGLTDNERYLISFEYPIRSDMLTDSMQGFVSAPDWDENYPAYIQQETVSLNTMSSGDWQPTIDELDTIINSIYITGGFEY
jgi:hypothetical protein